MLPDCVVVSILVIVESVSRMLPLRTLILRFWMFRPWMSMLPERVLMFRVPWKSVGIVRRVVRSVEPTFTIWKEKLVLCSNVNVPLLIPDSTVE